MARLPSVTRVLEAVLTWLVGVLTTVVVTNLSLPIHKLVWCLCLQFLQRNLEDTLCLARQLKQVILFHNIKAFVVVCHNCALMSSMTSSTKYT